MSTLHVWNRRGRGMQRAGVVLLMALVSISALAQRPTVRVLHAWNEPVKQGGPEQGYRVEVVFDYAAGEARQLVYDATGRLVERRVLVTQPRPTAEELAEAFAVIRADRTLGPLLAQHRGVLDGGFLLQEEAGKPCGPGTRCLQIDLLSADRRTSLRMVAADLVSGTIRHRVLHPGH